MVSDIIPLPGTDIETMFEPSHSVELAFGGFLAELSGLEKASVNSVHHQAIQELSPNLQADAVAEDGVVEAVHAGKDQFIVGVQWHPEWNTESDSLSQSLFKSFGDACRASAESQ